MIDVAFDRFSETTAKQIWYVLALLKRVTDLPGIEVIPYVRKGEFDEQALELVKIALQGFQHKLRMLDIPTHNEKPFE